MFVFYLRLSQSCYTVSVIVSVQTVLYGWIWRCRYAGLCLGLCLYVWRWYTHSSPHQENMLVLQQIRQDLVKLDKRVSGALCNANVQRQGAVLPLDSRPHQVRSKGSSRHSKPPLSPGTRWKIDNYRECIILLCTFALATH